MLARLSCPAAVAVCVVSLGCCGNLRCGNGVGCGADCGASYGGMKYDCACEEVCGPCSGGASGCSCTKPCDCGDKCRSGCGSDNCGQWPLLDKLCGCTGCGELYWSEWFCDPPACCEPCDCFGNYTGCGGAGHYRAPYHRHHGYAAGSPADVAPLELAERDDEMVE